MSEASKIKKLMEAIAGELITKDKTSTAEIARDIIKGAASSLYREGSRPTLVAVKQRSEKMAANFHSQLLMAIDNELGR